MAPYGHIYQDLSAVTSCLHLFLGFGFSAFWSANYFKQADVTLHTTAFWESEFRAAGVHQFYSCTATFNCHVACAGLARVLQLAASCRTSYSGNTHSSSYSAHPGSIRTQTPMTQPSSENRRVALLKLMHVHTLAQNPTFSWVFSTLYRGGYFSYFTTRHLMASP